MCVMWVACNRARFLATQPRVFCELRIMKIVILIYWIIQEKFAYGELFMLVMMGYIFMFKMVQKMQNSGLEIVAGLTRPLINSNITLKNSFLIFWKKNVTSYKQVFKPDWSLAGMYRKISLFIN